MITHINLSKSKRYELPLLTSNEAKSLSIDGEKGWGFSNIYYPVELKNIFIALKRLQYTNNKEFTEKAVKDKLPFVKTPWEWRRVLEQENALINFGLITKDRKITKDFFCETEYSTKLNLKDIEVFKKIYHSYFIFKELHSWLLKPIQNDHIAFLNQVTIETLQEKSLPIFSFSMENRFTDAFIFSLTDNTDIFRIPNENDKLMRFWDVYVKWGQELNLLEKFNLRNFDYELSNSYKSFSCVYYINPEKPAFDLLNFIKCHYRGKHINVARLILKIALQGRYRIDDIKEFIIDSASQNRQVFNLQRTSEVFLKNKEYIFLPKLNGSYISHLLIQ